METQPYECPECGGTEWKADYYEAVWQTVSLTRGDDGAPVFGDYLGVTGTYDDGSTQDECYRCRSCDHTIPLGRFEFTPTGAPAAVVVVYRHPDAETAISAWPDVSTIVVDYGVDFDGTPNDYETAEDWLEGIGYQLAANDLPADHPARVEVIGEALGCVAEFFDEARGLAQIENGERDARAARVKS